MLPRIRSGLERTPVFLWRGFCRAFLCYTSHLFIEDLEQVKKLGRKYFPLRLEDLLVACQYQGTYFVNRHVYRGSDQALTAFTLSVGFQLLKLLLGVLMAG
jgi:hypothetical protein